MKIYKSTCVLLAGLAFSCFVSAQYKVTFRLSAPVKHSPGLIFIAGNFNSWNSHDSASAFLSGSTGVAAYTLILPAGDQEFKFTRGSWEKVETTPEGKGISNRHFHLQKDTTINVDIGGWYDDFVQEAVVRKHTASANVKILDTAFYIPQLNRTRRIWLYLPADYDRHNKRLPVLYMHDGQNLFDENTSGFGEWGIDECLDSLFKKGNKECIVVGIDNGPLRMTEYNPYPYQKFGNGEGKEYVDFIVKTLKPFIDSHYKTLSDKKNTFIAGSSMGGLISLFAVARYPEIFGGAGIFSPAFQTAPGLDADIKVVASKMKSRLFFYAGGKEGNRMVTDMKHIESVIKKFSISKIAEIVDPEAQHNEAAWRKYFPQVYLWLMK